MTDKRPDPKPRKNIQLWQSYLIYEELVMIRKRHKNRISSIKAGKSVMDLKLEESFLEDFQIEKLIRKAKKAMTNYGETVGDIWGWATSFRGLKAGGLVACLLAQIDDIEKFDTVSKLWKFAGYGVTDGMADKNKKGIKSDHNKTLKSVCFLISEEFKRHHTPIYSDIYHHEKDRQKKLHPEVVCRTCLEKTGNEVLWVDCPIKKKPAKESDQHKMIYNDGHLDKRALRKAVKIFLQHLWLIWREAEGLPVTEPYVKAILGHTNIIYPSQPFINAG